jgi:hypothetical protein
MAARKYVSYRDIVVSSVMGHSIEFKKGVPTQCPPTMHAELLAIGIVPEEPMVEEPVVEGVQAPQDPEVRKKQLFEVFEKVALRNKRDDFTAKGMPHLSVLAKELGWAVEGKERDAVFQEWNIERISV